MLSQEENELLTRVGPGTPGGELLRRYWQPAALVEELPPGAPPVPVRLLGEDLVLFRDEHQAQPGLLGLHCSHRGADLSYGRLEDGGLRCIYHGWLYDIHGRCLDQPGEPAFRWTASGGRDSGESSGLEAQSAIRAPHSAIKHVAYPCKEAAGLILTYMGPGEAPLLPAYDFMTCPDEHVYALKNFHESNYLQGNEGNIDSVHLSFLHSRLDGDGRGRNLPGRGFDIIESEETNFGLRFYWVRKAGAEEQYVHITNLVMPNFSVFGGGRGNGYSVNWHVPIDDTHHWKYYVQYRGDAPIDAEAARRGRAELTPDYHLVRNKSNRYLQDREEMRTRTFAGIGPINQPQDACVIEGAGPIQDRTQEHLGFSDTAIVAERKLLLQAVRDVQEGRDPHHVVRRQEDNHFELLARGDIIPADWDWRTYWRDPEALQLAHPTWTQG